jgi:hypothetical protein
VRAYSRGSRTTKAANSGTNHCRLIFRQHSCAARQKKTSGGNRKISVFEHLCFLPLTASKFSLKII